MSALCLSLFPGIGLLDMAFEEQGFCVVRGPDRLWGGDIKRFSPPAGKFEGVIGGPPCQAFSALRSVNRGRTTKANLIPEFERVVAEARPDWFIMENVVAAPLPEVAGYYINSVVLLDASCGGISCRKRRFSFGNVGGERRLDVQLEALWSPRPEPSATACGYPKPGMPRDKRTRLKYLGWKTAEALKLSIAAQGLPENFLQDAPFTLAGKHRVIGNGVPLAMGRAVAKAVLMTLKEAEGK